MKFKTKRNFRALPNRQAFTLIELLVVIALIGLLSTLGVAYLFDSRTKAKDTTRIAEVEQIRKAIEIYVNDEFILPPTSGGKLCYRSDNASEWADLSDILKITLAVDPENLAGLRYAFFRTDQGIGCTQKPNCGWVMTRRQADEFVAVLPLYKGSYTGTQMAATWVSDCGGTGYAGFEEYK